MNKARFLLIFILTIFSVGSTTIKAEAQTRDCYTIENEFGEIIESGTIGNNLRITWSNISLEGNYTLNIFPSGSTGYYIKKGITLKMSYSLNKSVSTTLKVIQDDSDNVYEKSQTSSSVSGSYVSNETDYYKVQIKNNSSGTIVLNTITITY